jgi:putative oxidoreductase
VEVITVSVGLLVLRVVIGGLFIGHGAQKLFGWFGGHGPRGTGGFFESLGLRPGRVMALGAGLAELCGGVLFACGLLTPLAAALLIAVMVVAIATVHWTHGLWVTEGGFEYNLVLVAAAFAVAAIGAGEWSLDNALGLDVAGAGWALAALAAGLLGGVVAIAVGRFAARHQVGGTAPAGV